MCENIATQRNDTKRYYEQNRDSILEKNKIRYEQNKDAILERNKIKYEAKKDTDEWKEYRRGVNKKYADKRKERLKQEKELLIKLQAQVNALQ